MIIFNGVSIDSAAPVMVEDIRVSPISYSPVTRPRAVRFGADFVRMGGSERTVTVTLALLDRNNVTRHEAFLNLSAWARTDAEYRLELPQDPARYLQAVCISKPEPSTRAWWENKLRIVFACYDNPFWTDKAEKSVACGTQFIALGDAPPLARIESNITASTSAMTYGDGTNTMTFNFGGAASGRLVVDLNRQTAAINGASCMQYYTPASTFVVPKTGAQTITGAGTLYYRERWE